MQDPDEQPTVFGFAANRIVAFAGPHIAWISGAIATWLMGQIDIFAAFDVSNESLAGAISQALTFGVVTFVVWLGSQKWLDGFQKWAYEAIGGENNEAYVVSAGEDESPPDEAMAGFGEGEPPVEG